MTLDKRAFQLAAAALPLAADTVISVDRAGLAEAQRVPASHFLGPGVVKHIVSAEQVGLIGDGVTDDARSLNAHIKQQFDLGLFTHYYLRAPAGIGFRFDFPLRVLSNIWIYLLDPVILGREGRIRIQGQDGETPRGQEHGEPIPFLTADVALGATVLPLTVPTGWAPLSTLFPPGCRIVIRGELDAAGTAIERQETFVTAVNDGAGTITIADPAAYAYRAEMPDSAWTAASGTMDRTRVRRQLVAHLTADAAAGDTTIQVVAAELTGFQIGDMIMITDDELALDTSGASANLVNVEYNTVQAMLGGTVVLAGGLSNPISVGRAARIQKVIPALNAQVIGAQVSFAEAPLPAPAPRIHPFEISRGFRSFMIDCRILNQDDFGSRGNAFRNFRSLASGFVRPTLMNPKFLGAGDGYGCASYYSTDCFHQDLYVQGTRHSWIVQGANRCWATGISVDDRLTAIDLHGAGDRYNWCDITVIGGRRLTGENTTRTAVKFGNPTHRKGSFFNRVRARVLHWHQGDADEPALSRVVEIVPPASHNTAEVIVEGAARGIHGRDLDDPALVARGNRIVARMRDVRERVADIRTEAEGVRAFDGLELELHIDGFLDGPRLQQLGAVRLSGSLRGKNQHPGNPQGAWSSGASYALWDVVDHAGRAWLAIAATSPGQEPGVHPAWVPHLGALSRYALDCRDVAGLRVDDLTVAATVRGMQVEVSPAHRIHRCVFGPQLDQQHLADLGGNDGALWLDNTWDPQPLLDLSGGSAITRRDSASAGAEVGTWQPGISAMTTSGTATYDHRMGLWTRRGDDVTIWGSVKVTGFSPHPTGAARVHNLPFPRVGGSTPEAAIAVQIAAGVALASGYTMAAGYILGSSSLLRLRQLGGGETAQDIDASAISDGVHLIIHGTYRAQPVT